MMEADANPQRFRILDLPEDLQLRIYHLYFSCSKLKLVGNDDEGLRFEGTPNLSIEQPSRSVHLDARKTHEKCTPRTLVLTGEFFKSHLPTFTQDARYSWIRNHIDTFEIARYGLPGILGHDSE